MHSISKITSRYWYRSRLFWLLFSLSSYTVVGFLVLPSVIKDIALEQIEQNLGWQGSIQSIELNPFLLTLTINQFSIEDERGNKVISFDRYHNDIELRSIIEGAITFSNLELDTPYINLEIDENGKTNFHKAIEKTQANKPVETTSNNATPPPKLIFDRINVNAGEINVTDHTQTELITHQLKPISFALNNFSTFVNKAGDYQLDIALGTGQHLVWKGNLGIAPFHSSGFLKVENLRAEKLWAYAKHQVPYTLTHGLVGVEGQYEVSMAGNSPLLEVHNAAITLDKLNVTLPAEDTPFLDIDHVSVGPLDFNLTKQALDISRVNIDALSLKLQRDAQGELTLLAPFNTAAEPPSSASTPKPESSTDNTQPFQWSIGVININNSQVNIHDLQPQTPANITIENINSHFSGLSQDMTKSLRFDVSYFAESSGKSELKGQLTPTPFSLKSAINFNKLALGIIQPYLNEHAKVTIEEGTLSVNGSLLLSSNTNDKTLNGGFSGTVNINQFNTRDQSANERLVGWQNLMIEPVTVRLNPLAVEIDNIRLEQPYGRIIVTEDRSTNLAKLMVAPSNESINATKPEAESVEKNSSVPLAMAEKNAPIPLKINHIYLNNGAAYFADLSLTPQFGTSIQNINGEISGLSSDNLERATVDIKGTVEGYGKALVKGKVNPLSGDLYTDLAVKFDNIELSTMTPYSGRYAGYSIDKGKLNLSLNYKIANRVLEGENRLILDQFELGSAVNSEESVNLPLELALAILKDQNGVIDIDLPARGHLDDPDFKMSGLILKSFVNVITKAATAPFSMIGNLVGGDADALSSVSFEAGRSELTPEQLDNLSKLSEALISRPQIMLEIRATVDKNIDAEALKKIKLNKQLAGKQGSARITSLENLITRRAGQSELNKLKTKTTTSTTSETPDQPSTGSQTAITHNTYEQALYDAALKTEPVSSLELTTLAKQRISRIKSQLIEQNNVANEQVFALQPSLEGEAIDSKITTTFNLTAR